MSKAPPPTPPANRSNKGTGEEKSVENSEPAEEQARPDPDQKGQQANIKQNTTHHGADSSRS